MVAIMDSKITSITAYPVRHVLNGESYGSARSLASQRTSCFVRIETSDGIVGWGEGWGPGLPVAAIVDELASGLTGLFIDRVRAYLRRRAWSDYHRGGVVYRAALAAVDIATLDAIGKLHGLSVSHLLGTRMRDSVTAYASAGYYTQTWDPGRFRDGVASGIDGYTRIKIKCGRDIANDTERIRIAREVIGGDAGLMVDLNGSCVVGDVLQRLPVLEEYSVDWLEEPLAPGDLSGLRRIRERSNTTIACGEALHSRSQFQEIVASGLVDVIQVDVTKIGGLSEAVAVNMLAETSRLTVSPHVWGGAIGFAAALQLMAVADGFGSRHASLLEYDRGENSLRSEFLSNEFQCENGTVHIPDKPGLGIAIDLDAVKHYCIK